MVFKNIHGGKMGGNRNTLIQCPNCGHIQDHSNRCAKCGKDMMSQPDHQEAVAHDEGVMDVEDHDVSSPASESPTGLRLSVVSAKDNPESSAADANAQLAFPECPLPPDDRGSERHCFPVPIFMPLGKLVALSVITLCIYQIFWFRRNWKILQKYHDHRLEAGKLTFKMLIPFYGIYLVYTQFNTINTMVGRSGKGFPVTPVLAGWVGLFGWATIAGGLNMGFLPFSFGLLSALSLIPVQWSLNGYAQNIGEVPASRATGVGWIVGAVTAIALFMSIGAVDSHHRYTAMETFMNETAALNKTMASTGDETRDLLTHYGSYLQRAKAMMLSKGLLKKEKELVYSETSRLIKELPKKLKCVREEDKTAMRLFMTKFIEEGNTFLFKDKFLADSIADTSAKIEALVAANRPGGPAPTDDFSECVSEPFNYSAFLEDMRQKKEEYERQARTAKASQIEHQGAGTKDQEGTGLRGREQFSRQRVERMSENCMKFCDQWRDDQGSLKDCQDKCQSRLGAKY
jgi:hypothetical protein